MVRRMSRNSSKSNTESTINQRESPPKKRDASGKGEEAEQKIFGADVKEVNERTRRSLSERDNLPADTNGEHQIGGEKFRNDEMTSEQDEGTGKGKSKSKNKTDLENSSLLNENEQQTNSHISETVQVTAQSPSNDNPVDNENGNDKVSDATNNNQSVSRKVEHLNEDVRSGGDKSSSSVQVEEAVEPEQNIDYSKPNETKVDNQPSTYTEKSTNEKNPDVEPAQVKENKKIRLRRNTVHGTENSKIVKTVERSSSHIAIHGDEKHSSESEHMENEKSVKKAPVKVKLRRNKYLSASKSDKQSAEQAFSENSEKENAGESDVVHKEKSKKWLNLKQPSSVCKIDFQTIKHFCNKVEVLEEKDVKLDLPRERYKSSSEAGKKTERKVSIEYSEETEKPDYKKQTPNSSGDEAAKEESKNIIAFNRKISIVEDTASKLRPPPEPAKNPVSEVLFITNLVRPFTIKQLKELLERTGKIKGNGFWTDRIKSKCYVRYNSKDEAEATRNALHGVHWPIGNGKQLMIEYGTVGEMERAQNPPIPLTPPLADLKLEKILPEKENKDPVNPIKKRRISDDVRKEAPRDKTTRRSVGRVREWDIGKEDMHKRRSKSRSRERNKERSRSRERDKSRNRGRSRERNRSRDRDRDRSRHKRRRTPSPIEEYLARNQRKIEEEVPQKLMDDLFLKTKATPSIYWQPLSPEEIATKQQQRLIRMEEHKRRMEVSSRHRGGRESGRGVSYRRR